MREEETEKEKEKRVSVCGGQPRNGRQPRKIGRDTRDDVSFKTREYGKREGNEDKGG